MEIKIIYLTILLIQVNILTKEKHIYTLIKFNHYSEITLKIQGSGNQYVLYQSFTPLPDEVLINGTKTNFINNKPLIKLISNLNAISLKWDKNIENCDSMFMYRNNIIEIDLSKFDTSSVTTMKYLFLGCSLLESINFSNFNTSNVTECCSMFNGCSSLKSLDLSSFNTSKISNMGHMFNDCSSLTFLNLSNFDCKNVKYMDNMFKGCSSLVSLDLSNFDFSSINNINSMFLNCKKLEYINLKKAKSFFNNYETKSKIFETSPNLVICVNDTDNGNIKNQAECGIIDCTDDWRKNQKKVNTYDNKCVLDNQCNSTNYKYEYENKCYYECPNETFSYNYICINIKNINFQNTLLTEKIKDTKYITEKITSFDFVDSIRLINTKNIEIPKNTLSIEFDYPRNNFCSFIDVLNEKCKNNYINREEQNEYANYIVELILDGKLKNVLNTVINENKSIIINENDITHQITKLSLLNNSNNNLTSINYGYCEKYLKSYYGINETEELIIYKIEHKIKEYKIPIIEYTIFNGDGTKKLSLDCCSNISIEYNIPISINENDLDKYNSTSKYYTDECSKTKSKDGLDLTIYDKKFEYNEKNMSLCEFNCTYKGYNINTSKVKCFCPPKGEINSSETKQELNKISNEKKSTNFDIAKCYNLFKSKEELVSNSGFFILLFILAFFLIIFLIFCIRGKQNLIDKIDEIIAKKSKNIKEILGENKNHKRNSKNMKNIKLIKKDKLKTKKKSTNLAKSMIITSNTKKTKRRNCLKSKNINKNNINLSSKSCKLKFNEYELNSMEYKDALKYDNRTYCDYYLSLIKTKQMIIFSFCTFDDYNSGIIKKYTLFQSFAFHYTSNAVFFTDETMHQIVKDKGTFNFIYQIRFIIYSSIISTFFLRIFLLLIMTEKEIVSIKHKHDKNSALIQKTKVIKCINIKFLFFFILNIVLLSLFWYYLTCFNALYQNTQFYLIKNTLISFGFSLLYPFIINIFPGILRINSLKHKKRKKGENSDEYKYKFSKILQIL